MRHGLRRPGATALAALAVGVAALVMPPPAGAVGLTGAPTCDVAPANSVWRTPITSLPVAKNSSALIAKVGASTGLHPDFGSGLWDGGPIGIPYNTVAAGQRKVHVSFLYASESDRVGYPVPRSPRIEGGAGSTGDRHVLVVDRSTCRDYELYDARPVARSVNWTAGSGAVFNLRSDALRTRGWTSADAAGLAILPGLVRPEEVAAGVIDHAIRVTVPATAATFLWPARHEAGVHDATLPPMGLRLRLKATIDVSHYPRVDRVILQALKTYGMIIADNGSAWYLSGVPSAAWNNDQLHLLGGIVGSDFQVVDESCLEVAPNSAQASLARCTHASTSHAPSVPRPQKGAGGPAMLAVMVAPGRSSPRAARAA